MPHTWVGAEFATADTTDAVPGEWLHARVIPRRSRIWWEGEGITLRELPTAFGVANLRARRLKSRVIVELALTGPAPQRSRSGILALSGLKLMESHATSTAT